MGLKIMAFYVCVCKPQLGRPERSSFVLQIPAFVSTGNQDHNRYPLGQQTGEERVKNPHQKNQQKLQTDLSVTWCEEWSL
jgi:hypothetical protein